MKTIFSRLIVGIAALFAAAAFAAPIGKVDTAWQLLGANDSIQVDSMNDPDVKGMTCHISYSKRGGLTGAVGLAEERSRFSLACRQTGPLVLSGDIRKQARINAFDRNIFFKEMIVTRMYDEANRTLIYLVTSKGLIDGSPFNSISTIPLAPWGTMEPVIK